MSNSFFREGFEKSMVYPLKVSMCVSTAFLSLSVRVNWRLAPSVLRMVQVDGGPGSVDVELGDCIVEGEAVDGRNPDRLEGGEPGEDPHSVGDHQSPQGVPLPLG